MKRAHENLPELWIDFLARSTAGLFSFIGGASVFSFFWLYTSSVEGAVGDAFFDDSYVHEIRLTFEDPNWYSVLYESHLNDPEEPYFAAAFEGDGVSIPVIGVRFKGNSSFRGDSIKKSLKLDFNEFEDFTFQGLKKLNLNNGFNDPTLLREKLFLDFAAKYVPTIRAVHTRVYVNNEYMGLYIGIEQVDKTFVQNRFGSGEDGNLYKGAVRDELNVNPQDDFGSDLVWEGADESAYYDHYQLKTNESANDYSGLVAFIDTLNNVDPALFPEQLEPILDVDNVLASIALNSLFMNLDSYSGAAHNYYLYQSDSTGQFSHIFWDLNESFGSFLRTWTGTHPFETDPFWVPIVEPRPLMERLWMNETYEQRYIDLYARMLREGFDVETMVPRIEALADMIRADVYADPNKFFINEIFERNLTSDVGTLFGLEKFIRERSNYLNSVFDGYANQSDLRINEVLPLNESSFMDTFGDSDPWIEIYNPSTSMLSLSGLFLSDSLEEKTKWAMPDVSVESGGYYLVWMDGEASEGADHASFSISSSGGNLYLFDNDQSLIGNIEYPATEANIGFERYPDGEDNYVLSDQPSPAMPNKLSSGPSVTLFINEILADNEDTIQDPDGTGFPDWIELYNPNAFPVDLGGMYLADDVSQSTQWRIPDGISIEANGFLLIWADDDEEQGPTHANFKLSSGGEAVALFDKDIFGNLLIDLVTFDAQSADVSFGRETDGSSVFRTFDPPTPGIGNACVDCVLRITTDLKRLNVGPGYGEVLDVEATGTGPYSYQWFLDGDPIPEAMGNSFPLDDLVPGRAGAYSVAVSNAFYTDHRKIAIVTIDSLEPLTDEDGDGVANAVESAFGMNALVPDYDQLPEFLYSDGSVQLAFRENRDDLVYLVESSDDLVSWTAEVVEFDGDDLRSFAARLPGVGVRFYRIRVMGEN